jgi:hypothetical protein
MVSRKSAEPSPVSGARANRQRLAQEEGLRAIADVEQRAIAIRKNMERLRALREAKEAQEAVARPALAEVSKKKRRKPLSVSVLSPRGLTPREISECHVRLSRVSVPAAIIARDSAGHCRTRHGNAKSAFRCMRFETNSQTAVGIFAIVVVDPKAAKKQR